MADKSKSERENVYGNIFGEPDIANHELMPFDPHVEIYIYSPETSQRPFYTIATSGLSNERMPNSQSIEFKRIELILYAKEPKKIYIDLLRYLSHIPHDQQTCFTPGGTMTNGVPPQPVFDESDLNCFVFLFPIISPDDSLDSKLVINGDPVSFLWPVAISKQECDLVRDNRVEDLLELFEKNQHPFLIDEQRKSYL